MAELQEFSRGIHPTILSVRGLGPALRSLARRCAVPVDLDVTIDARYPEPIEIAAYYVASEALANAMKHAHASHIGVSLATRDGSLLLSIGDDGIGGADPARASGRSGSPTASKPWAARSTSTAVSGPERTSRRTFRSSRSRLTVPVDGCSRATFGWPASLYYVDHADTEDTDVGARTAEQQVTGALPGARA